IDPRRDFSDNELSLAQAIANVVGNALENGRLYSALARRAAQLEAAYNDLREADRLTDEMIQNISHELRTPLAPVIGYTDMMLSEVPTDLPDIYDDEERVLQVFESLISNAMKFSPHGGQVRIAIHDISHSLQVDISAQGIGIAPEEHAKIWRRFYQVDGSATR